MATILELTSNIVSSHASTTPMSSDELVQEIKTVYASLNALEAVMAVEVIADVKPMLAVKDAFKKNEVICLVCGKGKMKTLTRHLNIVHNMKSGEYKRQFGISSKQPLTARSYSESRRKFAEERGLGDVLAKARDVRMAKLKEKRVATGKPKTIKRSR